MQTLAKIQVTAIFVIQDMWRSFFPKFREICMETPCWPHSGRKLTETSVTKFCNKIVNVSLEELENIQIMLFRTQELLRLPNSLK